MKIHHYRTMQALLRGSPRSIYDDRPCIFAFMTEEEAEAAQNGAKNVNAKLIWGMNIQDVAQRACAMTGKQPHQLRMLPYTPILDMNEPHQVDLFMLEKSKMEIPNYSSVLTKWLINIITQSNIHDTEEGKAFVAELKSA